MLSLTKGDNRYPKPRRGIIYPEFNFTEESIVSIIKERMKINALALHPRGRTLGVCDTEENRMGDGTIELGAVVSE